MSAVLGNVIVIGILAVLVFFCARSVFRRFKAELAGEATCGSCSGSCHGCSSCGSCAGTKKKKQHQ